MRKHRVSDQSETSVAKNAPNPHIQKTQETDVESIPQLQYVSDTVRSLNDYEGMVTKP